jgi:hypothetical protein
MTWSQERAASGTAAKLIGSKIGIKESADQEAAARKARADLGTTCTPRFRSEVTVICEEQGPQSQKCSTRLGDLGADGEFVTLSCPGPSIMNILPSRR